MDKAYLMQHQGSGNMLSMRAVAASNCSVSSLAGCVAGRAGIVVTACQALLMQAVPERAFGSWVHVFELPHYRRLVIHGFRTASPMGHMGTANTSWLSQAQTTLLSE